MTRKLNLKLEWGKPKTNAVVSKGLKTVGYSYLLEHRDEEQAAKIEKLFENYEETSTQVSRLLLPIYPAGSDSSSTPEKFWRFIL